MDKCRGFAWNKILRDTLPLAQRKGNVCNRKQRSDRGLNRLEGGSAADKRDDGSYITGATSEVVAWHGRLTRQYVLNGNWRSPVSQ